MNTPTKKKSTSALTTVLITLFIIFCSAASQASNDVKALKHIINHKVNIEKLGVGVAAAVIENDTTSFINIGYANQATKQNVDESVYFEIGSISKTFTAMALASMVNEGKLTLTDAVQPYLPKQVTLPIYNNKPITFLSLANHTSGLPRLPNNMTFVNPENPYADYSIEDMYQFLSNYQLPREPGSTPEYSNLGMGLLGHVLSLIDKKSYQAMIQDRVLTPLEMENTFIDIPVSERKQLSQGYNDQLKPTQHWQLPALQGAGALKSTIKDMAIYLQKSMNNEVLTDDFSLTQTANASFTGANTSVGLAWIIDENSGNKILMHDGGTGGYRSFIGFNEQNNKGIVILANTAISMNKIAHAFLTNSLDSVQLNKPVTLTSEQLSQLSGEYELAPSFTLTITNNGKQLFVQATGQPKLALNSQSATEFINHAVGAKISFETNKEGKSLSLTLHQGGQSMPGVKR